MLWLSKIAFLFNARQYANVRIPSLQFPRPFTVNAVENIGSFNSYSGESDMYCLSIVALNPTDWQHSGRFLDHMSLTVERVTCIAYQL